jgi:hypothetical protein
MHLKVFVKLKKTLSSGQKNPKKPKKTQKKNKKTQKNPLGWVFFLKNPGFFQPCRIRIRNIDWNGEGFSVRRNICKRILNKLSSGEEGPQWTYLGNGR